MKWSPPRSPPISTGRFSRPAQPANGSCGRRTPISKRRAERLRSLLLRPGPGSWRRLGVASSRSALCRGASRSDLAWGETESVEEFLKARLRGVHIESRSEQHLDIWKVAANVMEQLHLFVHVVAIIESHIDQQADERVDVLTRLKIFYLLKQT